jgi:hypothetical protein
VFLADAWAHKGNIVRCYWEEDVWWINTSGGICLGGLY